MRNHVFIIASIAEVGPVQLSDLINLYHSGDTRVKSYQFSAPSQCDDALVSLVGKGYAFNAGYNTLDTVSMVINLG